jgi:hypothetical protein
MASVGLLNVNLAVSKKKPLDHSGFTLKTGIVVKTFIGAQEGTRTPTKLLAST